MTMGLIGALVWVVVCVVMGVRWTRERSRLKAEVSALKKRLETEASAAREATEQLDRVTRAASGDVQLMASNAEQALEQGSRLAKALETERRKARELFDVVEKVLAERDQWKSMWFDHGREHLNAQTQLENALIQSRGWLKTAAESVNKYRESAGQKPLPLGLDPKDPPVGTAARFEALLEQAKNEAPPSVDGLKLRDQIGSSSEENS